MHKDNRLAHSKPASEGLREAAALALMYLETGFIECEQCGHEQETRTLDAVYELRTVVEPAASDTPLTEPQRLGQEGEAYDIASRISVSEFPGKTFTERLENARIVLAALTPAQAEPVATWDCVCGQKQLIGRVCPLCGKQRPAQDFDAGVVEAVAAVLRAEPFRLGEYRGFDPIAIAQAALDAALPLLAEARGERS